MVENSTFYSDDVIVPLSEVDQEFVGLHIAMSIGVCALADRFSLSIFCGKQAAMVGLGTHCTSGE